MEVATGSGHALGVSGGGDAGLSVGEAGGVGDGGEGGVEGRGAAAGAGAGSAGGDAKAAKARTTGGAEDAHQMQEIERLRKHTESLER